MTLSSPYNPLAWNAVVTASAKNKSTEKNPESEEALLQHRTDGKDAFDTLYISCEKFQQYDFYGRFMLAVLGK